MATRSPLFGLLGLLLLVACLVSSASASPTDSRGPARLHSRQSGIQDEKKTSERCNYTGQCAPCAQQNLRNAINMQCCWPRGRGYGSPFDSPGFCLCAPVDRYDYSQCLGGFVTS
ncbi:hypothetical protein GGTG_05615 [Gaeumannomyces tritici R3-111a-1]|uniref:Uncharacterized protein n=1 Tax=Gaeumannomyces tritici (strain R3-111a-1) TaxID=644352 RepID=J3NWF1_GAET3|nr:hypothetical protein GGTG_05615 [Gaeumannomyces tritici R3-111a-1]EJT75683.1 hypothetical protein GGTG_05615 [Gaeumannomyces tritici R3-111a-1]